MRALLFIAGVAFLGIGREAGANVVGAAFDAKRVPSVTIVSFPQELSLYQPGIIRLEVEAAYNNPYDPREIDIQAHLGGPGGRRLTLPCYYCQPYDITHTPEGWDRLTPDGRPEWRAKVALTAVGEWHGYVVVKTPLGRARSETFHIRCRPSGRPGPVHVDSSHRYFETADGRIFYPIGYNRMTARSYEEHMRGQWSLRDWDRWFRPLAEAGGNVVRVWSCYWSLGLEWRPIEKAPFLGYKGLGRYSQPNSYLLERTLEIADNHRLRVMLVLEYHHPFKADREWNDNPYSVRQGGPCNAPGDFWTNPEARRLWKQRLRYTVARFAAEPGLLCWDMLNEVNAPVKWLDEMAAYLHEADPYRHPVTTSWCRGEIRNALQLDFLTEHVYGDPEKREWRNLGGHLRWVCLNWSKSRYWPVDRPVLIGEFGISPYKSADELEPGGRGIWLHNGLWYCFISGGAGALPWGMMKGTEYLEDHDLWHQFTPLAQFVKLVPWDERPFAPLPKPLRTTNEHAAAYGLKGRSATVIWVHDTRSTWWGAHTGWKARRIRDCKVSIPAESQHAEVLLFYTWNGSIVEKRKLPSAGGVLEVVLPPFKRDMGMIIRWRR